MRDAPSLAVVPMPVLAAPMAPMMGLVPSVGAPVRFAPGEHRFSAPGDFPVWVANPRASYDRPTCNRYVVNRPASSTNQTYI